MSPDVRFLAVLRFRRFDSASEMSPAGIHAVARAIEGAGFGGIGVSDHPSSHHDRGRQSLDPLPVLAHIAAATAHVQLFTYALVLPYRNVHVVAHSAATVDVLSGGRLCLVVATGYLRPEFEYLGVPFAQRSALFDTKLERFSALLRSSDLSPAPTRGTIPLAIAGNSRRVLRHVARRGLGWAPFISSAALASRAGTPRIESPADLSERLSELDALRPSPATAPSEPAVVIVNPSGLTLDHPPAAVAHQIAEWAAHGATWCAVPIDLAASLTGTIEKVEQFGRDVIQSRAAGGRS